MFGGETARPLRVLGGPAVGGPVWGGQSGGCGTGDATRVNLYYPHGAPQTTRTTPALLKFAEQPTKHPTSPGVSNNENPLS